MIAFALTTLISLSWSASQLQDSAWLQRDGFASSKNSEFQAWSSQWELTANSFDHANHRLALEIEDCKTGEAQWIEVQFSGDKTDLEIAALIIGPRGSQFGFAYEWNSSMGAWVQSELRAFRFDPSDLKTKAEDQEFSLAELERQIILSKLSKREVSVTALDALSGLIKNWDTSLEAAQKSAYQILDEEMDEQFFKMDQINADLRRLQWIRLRNSVN